MILVIAVILRHGCENRRTLGNFSTLAVTDVESCAVAEKLGI